MAQVTTTPTSPLTSVARRWKLTTALVLVGIGAGVGAAYTTPTVYTGEARVAVGSQSLDARVVAGYSEAIAQLASDVSRYVNDRQAQSDLEPVLGDLAGDVERVSASPIAGSSVILVEVDAESAAAATRGAQTVAQQLVDEVNSTTAAGPAELLQQYTDITNQVAAAQQAASMAEGALSAAVAAGRSQAQIDAARAAAEQSAAALDVLEVQQEALSAQYRNAVTNTPSASGLSIVQEAEVSRTNASSKLQRYGLIGAALGFFAALLIAVLLERRRAESNGTGTAEQVARPAAAVDVARTGAHAPEKAPSGAWRP
ncbi:YveK family protein [Kineococcus auxinigenes]|uniref:hypothetical protein n=1 Tax=unclassified Kineococcus TaxID=2621656 RepID=UPI003D7C56DF